MMMSSLIEEINSLVNDGVIEEDVENVWRARISEGSLVKEDNFADHLCAFFLPVHKLSKSIYLGHHVKADEWIPPGGHIELKECPKETVRREFKEELGVELENELIRLVGLTVTEIDLKPGRACERHWDMWYVVEVGKMNDYQYEKREFHTANWLRWSEGVKIMNPKRDEYLKIMKRIGRSL